MDEQGSKCLLVKYDVSGIQDYIFATNRLRENAGASIQVTRILKEFLPAAFCNFGHADETLEEMGIYLGWESYSSLRMLEDAKIRAEILYIGGGNAVVLYRDKALFRTVGIKLGMRAARDCPGLYLAAAYLEIDLRGEDFEKDKLALDRKMEEVKGRMVRQPIYSPFPVVEQDGLSHQPITDSIGKTAENVTRIQFQKRQAYEQIREYRQLFPNLKGEYDYPEEMDQLCRSRGEDSFIAVIHIDGNGMGDRIRRKLEGSGGYSAGVSLLREESKAISELFNRAYAGVLSRLWDCQAFSEAGGEGVLKGGGGEGKVARKIFPLRPIILDGDDFTILSTAELAIPIVAVFMEELFHNQKNQEEKISACAGIAFVHSHFPFSVAYSIGEEACSRAKAKWYEDKAAAGSPPERAYLDFQIIKDSEVGLSKRHEDDPTGPYCAYPMTGEEDSLKSLYSILKKLEDWPSGILHKLYRAIPEGENALKLLHAELKSRGYDWKQLSGGKMRASRVFDALELQGMCSLELLEDLLNLSGRECK